MKEQDNYVLEQSNRVIDRVAASDDKTPSLRLEPVTPTTLRTHQQQGEYLSSRLARRDY